MLPGLRFLATKIGGSAHFMGVTVLVKNSDNEEILCTTDLPQKLVTYLFL
jgi:hypothetical protein